MEYRINFKKEYGVKNNFPRWAVILFDVVFVLLVCLSIIISVLSIIYIRTPVLGESMKPTINTQWTSDNPESDIVLIDRLNYGTYKDIIVIKADDASNGDTVIKRLIAKGGDKIAIKQFSGNEYKIYLIKKGTDTPLDTQDEFCGNMSVTYSNFTTLLSNQLLLNKTGSTVETIDGTKFLCIPDDCIFYLGDNRAQSNDCSKNGPQKAKNVIGKVVLIIESDQNVFTRCAQYFISKMFGG